jgi:hypothetical protein
MRVSCAKPDLGISPLHLPAQLRTRSVTARSTLRLSVADAVDHVRRPPGKLRVMSADSVPDHQRPRVLLTVDDAGSVVINRPAADSARESLADPVLTVAFVMGGLREEGVFG